jgi:hypothetical protein
MVYRRSETALGLPVEQVAQMLVEAGQRDPTLLGRSQVKSAGRLGERPPEPLPLLSVQHHFASAPDPYMEQLVSIAIASARRAEDASEQASQTGRIAMRTAKVVTVLGAVGGLVGIAGIVDHRLNTRLAPGLEAITSNDQPSEAQRPTSGPSGTLGDQPEHAPIDLGAPQGNTAPMRDGVITPVSTPHDVVTARSSAEKFDDELGATTGRTISQVPYGTATPVAGTVGGAYPTQPYGFNASASVQPLPSRGIVSSSAQRWPSRPYGPPLPNQYRYPRRVEPFSASGPSGNPVRDFQRFVTAMGQGIRSIFR